MKTSKKLLSLLLVLAMVFALGCTAYAADSEGAESTETTESAEGAETPAEG